MRYLLKEFKKFAMRGNVIDLAVGIIIGASFGKIVSSFVNDILMPVIGMFLGKVDFSNLFINLPGNNYPTIAAAKAAGAGSINYGLFINTIVDFLIIAFAIFLLIKQINKFAPKAKELVLQKECPYCCSMINIKATKCPNCTAEL